MIFNPEICYTYMYKTQNQLNMDYFMEGVSLKSVSYYTYLGVELFKWKTHIDNITSKANKAVKLIKRHLYIYMCLQ